MLDTNEFTLERDDRGPLTFTGLKIADVSSHRHGAERWTELRVYRVVKNGVVKDKWVVESVGATTHEDEITYRSARVATSPTEVVEALKRNGRLVGLGMDAAACAADDDVDDKLDEFLYEEEKL